MRIALHIRKLGRSQMQRGLALLQSASKHARGLGHQRQRSAQMTWLHTHGLRPQVTSVI